MIKKILSILGVLVLLMSSCQTFAFPNGNYFQTCHRCSYRNRRLSCRCRRRNGRRRWTTLRVSPRCLYVKNLNGILTCTRLSPMPIIPVPPVRRTKRFVVSFKGPSGWNRGSYIRQCRRACRIIDRNWSGSSRAVRSGKLRVNCYCH